MSGRRTHVLPLLMALALMVLGPWGIAHAQPGDDVDATGPLTPDPSLQEIPPYADASRPGAATLLLLTFALLILLPFVPGLIEVYWPRDRYPLSVNTGYTKDPRFFGRSARGLLAGALDVDGVAPGSHEVVLSKAETVEVRDDFEIPAGAGQAAVLVARGELAVGAGAACERELFSRGGARVGAGATLRTLACDADVELAEGVVVRRWLDADGDVTVGPGCILGVSAAAGGSLTLADGVVFSRLYGSPVATTGAPGLGDGGEPGARVVPDRSPPYLDVDEIRTIEDLAHVHRNDLTVSPGDEFQRPLVVKGDLTIAAGAVLAYTARVYGTLRLERGAAIWGDVFAEGDVILAEGAAVHGNVFSQAAVSLASGAHVGVPGARKTLIGKKDIRLGAGVAVHGYILTDGRGRVACAGSS
ncbi:polymer-forming cytoskeletal protein [bacterium]|nr:polymer-forming cytoskeletal protein [bacterium]